MKIYSIVITATVEATSEEEAEEKMLAIAPNDNFDAVGATIWRGTVHADGGAEALRINDNYRG